LAQKININGTLISKPGVYSLIKSGVKNPSTALPYGNLCIIDTGFGTGWGGGSGINGQLSQGLNSIYKLQTSSDYAAFVKGGELWNFTKPLWTPFQNQPGVNLIYFIKAATTVPATKTLTLSNGTLVFTVLDEGTVGNGVLNAGNLTNGYAVKLTAGVVDPTKFIVTAYLGTYRGFDSTNGVDYSSSPANSVPQVIVTSPEFATIADFNSWANITSSFLDLFTLTSTTTSLTVPSVTLTGSRSNGSLGAATYYIKVTALNENGETTGSTETSYVASGSTSSIAVAFPVIPGAVSYNVYYGTSAAGENKYFNTLTNSFTLTTVTGGVSATVPVVNTAVGGSFSTADLTTVAGYNLFAGGTETYDSQDLTDALNACSNLNNQFFLSLESGSAATSANNFAILDFINTNFTKLERQLVVAGGYNKTTFTGTNSSILAAQTFNSQDVIVVHGGVKVTKKTSSGYYTYSQLYKAANVVGRICGLLPQNPVTFKQLGYNAEIHNLSDFGVGSEVEQALSAGVLVSAFDYDLGYISVVLGCNTLQENSYPVNDNGTSYLIQIRRICSYLNKSLVLNLKKKFFSDQSQGPNRATVSSVDLIDAATSFLASNVSSILKPGLIQSYANIQASLQGTAYYLSYDFTPDFEVDYIISTGTLVE
jgi:hypothetical protein